MRKTTQRVTMPMRAFGSRALNSFTPKRCMAPACIQKNSGGFSAKGW